MEKVGLSYKLFLIVDDPRMYVEFQFEPGQIQFLNNRLIGHKRTGFKDASKMENGFIMDSTRGFYPFLTTLALTSRIQTVYQIILKRPLGKIIAYTEVIKEMDIRFANLLTKKLNYF